jgi:rhomboid protease GluP
MYVVAGLCGSLVSLFWNPLVASAGASGAIFGVYGALLGLLLRQQGSVPTKALAQLRNSGLVFLGYNLLVGMMMHEKIDSAAHVGGLVAGFLCGVVLNQPLTPASLAGRRVRNFRVLGVGAFLVLGGMLGVHATHANVREVQAELDRFEAVWTKSFDAYNSAVNRVQTGKLTEARFADLLERDMLPEWRDSRERLAALKNVPLPFQSYVTELLEYMRLRQEAWELLVQGLREGNEAKLREVTEKQKLADDVAERMRRSGGH